LQHCVSVYNTVIYYSLTTIKGNKAPFDSIDEKLIGKPGSHVKRKRVLVGHLMPTFSGSGIPPFLSFSVLPNFQGLTALFFFLHPFLFIKAKGVLVHTFLPNIMEFLWSQSLRYCEYFTIFSLWPEKTCTHRGRWSGK
jgi:hypothetical protein